MSRYQNVSIFYFTGAKDDGDGDDNRSYKTCKDPVKSPTNQHPAFLYRPDALPVAQVAASKQCGKKSPLFEVNISNAKALLCSYHSGSFAERKEEKRGREINGIWPVFSGLAAYSDRFSLRSVFVLSIFICWHFLNFKYGFVVPLPIPSH